MWVLLNGRRNSSLRGSQFVPKEAKAWICAHVRLCEKENDSLVCGMCVANNLTLTLGDYPELFQWAQYNPRWSLKVKRQEEEGNQRLPHEQDLAKHCWLWKQRREMGHEPRNVGNLKKLENRKIFSQSLEGT